MAVDSDELCKDEQILLSLIIATLLLFIYLMTSSIYPRAKRMRKCNFVSVELPAAVFTGKNLTGIGSSPSKMPTLPSLFLTSAELDIFSHEPPAPQRDLLLTTEECLLLRAESRSGCYIKGKESTLFNAKYGDTPFTTSSTVTKEFRTVLRHVKRLVDLCGSDYLLARDERQCSH
ncbi:hypothetical protein KIN20_030444 [Parelaphostrongylus tenuis]|uniref:Uncharacterized protein n=1 Tax=Parelaphostrongylus tenuis TaxID=148309 RepID=A0AAD5R430_PARTN|nr:hypothetical protein KIN20_030444 [Parelaphostrongylus tenuis]